MILFEKVTISSSLIGLTVYYNRMSGILIRMITNIYIYIEFRSVSYPVVVYAAHILDILILLGLSI